ncbi:MAG: DUF547 domain-containing protein [Deltaproteobacteria bacterium]|nr:DUF547 domain-containing protein [Deltaproteobacteria bacterium]
MIQLPIRFGFHEYFDSQTGEGYGSSDFSWTSSLFLELVYEYYEKDGSGSIVHGSGNSRALGKRIIMNQQRRNKVAASRDTGSALMASISDLKNRFYDLERGLVDYDALRESPAYARYRDIAASLQGFDLTLLFSPDQKKAFWINLYNTIVVHGIVELGIRSSVKEVTDFFRNIAYRVGGFSFSADEIEHGILRANARPPFRIRRLFSRNDPRRSLGLIVADPRIHFALVCGSRSCAPIDYYAPESIDRQLETAAEHFINSSEVLILPERNKIFLSQIFRWYWRDFGKREDLFRFLLKYMADQEKAEFLEEHMDTVKVEYLFYDWNLNH